MVPSSFMVLERLPLTPNGKIDVRALPVPEVVSSQTYRAPISAAQVLLCKLYEELTGARQVGLDDGFFALGGDSITSIRLVSRARQAGLGLSVRDVFAHPTVAALAQVVQTLTGDALLIAAPAPGAVGLTPVQQQFLTEGGPLGRFHQAIVVEPPVGVGREQVQAALVQLLAHHDALRLKVHSPAQTEGGVQFWLDAPEGGERFELEVLDVSEQSQPEASAQTQAALRGLPARLEMTRGQMMAGVWVQRAQGQRAVLLLAVHHLVVDGVSWRVLLEDLDHLTAGRALPARTHSMRDWAQYLAAQAHSAKRLGEMAVWREVLSGAAPLPSEGQVRAEDNVVGQVRHHESFVSAKVLEQLISATAVYRAGIDDLLLTALGLAVYGWRRGFYGQQGQAGKGALLVDLEGHGRESEDSQLDLTRTVGWFTSAHPVRLDLEGLDVDEALQGGASAGLALRRMKEGLRRTGDRGLGYGMLRWLNAQTRETLEALPHAQMAFNYLGRFERTQQSQGEGWQLSDNVLVGGEDDPKRRRLHLLEVNAGIDGSGALGIGWGYHPGAHSQAAVVDLAGRFSQALEALVRHCHETPLAQRLTPSDFPLAKQAGLDQALLDQLVQLSGFEEVLPLAPLQQGLAYESWSQGEHRQNDPYHVQLAVGLEGVLDAVRLKQAFEQLVARTGCCV
jgi:non-ribosomal peptide synthase protein (TIGR01720 family)